MRQVELVVQVESDEQADHAFSALEELVHRHRLFLASIEALDVFVADDLGTVSRP